MDQTSNLPWQPGILADAAADYFARRATGRARLGEHPLVAEMLNQNVTAKDIAFAIAFAIASRHGPARPGAAMFTSGDFAAVLAQTAGILVAQVYGASNAHRMISRSIPTKNFLPTTFPSLDVNEKVGADPLFEGSEATTIRIQTAGGLTAQLKRRARVFAVSSEAVANDELEVVLTVIAQAGALIARNEATALLALLTGATTLADSRAMFNATPDGNLLTTAALNLANLGAASAILRRQPTLTGNAAGNAGRFLLVAPEQEVAALALVRSITPEASTPRMEVLSFPEIASGTWFLMASPDVAPVLGFMFLRGAKSTITTVPARVVASEPGAAYAGLGIGVVNIHGAVALGRVGAVKATA